MHQMTLSKPKSTYLKYKKSGSSAKSISRGFPHGVPGTAVRQIPSKPKKAPTVERKEQQERKSSSRPKIKALDGNVITFRHQLNLQTGWLFLKIFYRKLHHLEFQVGNILCTIRPEVLMQDINTK